MAKWAKCWDAIYSGLRFNQRSYIDAYIVPYGSLTALKTFLPRFRILRKKKRKKEREKEKSLFQNPRVINLRGAFPIKFFIRWLHTGQRANKHR